MRENLTPQQEIERAGWRYRTIKALTPPKSPEATILRLCLLAALGTHDKRPPWLGPSCIITAEGVVRANYVDADNVVHTAAIVCQDVQDMVDGFRRLADHCDLTDVERGELFDEVRKWVKADGRVGPSNMENDR